MNTSVSFLKVSAGRIDNFVKGYFGREIVKAKKIDPLAVETLKSLRDFMFGGKKVRGSLTILGYLMAGGKDMGKIVPVAAAVELMHAALLIHDDFIDKDQMRRGKPTMHVSYSKKKENHHYGASMALIVGDVGIITSNKLINESAFSEAKKCKALKYFHKYLIDTCQGELMDIDFDTNSQVTWDDLIKVRTYKTAYYTFVMPLTVGSVIAGKEKLNKIYERYGKPVGIAFQLADDLLGVYGNPKELGKSNESDIREGKKTLLWAYFMDKATSEEKEYMQRWYGASDLGKKQIDKIRELFITSASREKCEKMAKDLAEKGKMSLKNIKINAKYKQILLDLADFVVSRQS